jgi:hypothetical protein
MPRGIFATISFTEIKKIPKITGEIQRRAERLHDHVNTEVLQLLDKRTEGSRGSEVLQLLDKRTEGSRGSEVLQLLDKRTEGSTGPKRLTWVVRSPSEQAEQVTPFVLNWMHLHHLPLRSYYLRSRARTVQRSRPR